MKLTTEEKEQICQLYIDGEIIKILALQFKVRTTTIGTTLADAGIPRRETAKLTTEERAKICTLYQKEGKTTQALGLQFKVSGVTIRKILVTAGIPRYKPGHSKFRKASERESVVQLYLEGGNCDRIARLFDVSIPTVATVLKKVGKLRTISERAQIYRRNSHYFDNIDSSQKAYWLGLLGADGCVSGNRVSLDLNVNDKYLVQRFINDMESDAPILITKRLHPQGFTTIMSTFRIGDQFLCNSLRKLGITDRKTYILKFPDIKEEYFSHFIRGFVDGDGSIFGVKQERRLTTQAHFNLPSASKEFIMAIQEILIEKCRLNRNTLGNKDNFFILNFHGNNVCYRIYRYLYKDATRWMSRKRDKFEEILKGKIAQQFLDL